MVKRYRLFIITFVLLGVAALFIAPKLAAQRLKQPLPATLDNLHEVSRVEIKNADNQIVLAGTFSTKSDTSKEIEREAILTSPSGEATVKGLAEIEITKGNVPVKQELEMKLERLAASMGFTLFIDGKEIMMLQTNKRGNADIKLSTAIKR